jgi:hypothetical protein
VRDRRVNDNFWPPELATFDEGYWATRSEVPPGDYTPNQLALWRQIFATRAFYAERQKWARDHGGSVLDEVIAHSRVKSALLEQMLRENPDTAA